MKRARRITLAATAALLVVTAAEWVRERNVTPADLRAFDAAEVGRLDTEMWRSYYERHEVRLFGQMITLLRKQYGMPPLRALLNAYRAAHAAFVFKDGRSRADYQRALPDLEAYYADIAEHASEAFDSRRAAELELEWWIVHRERMDLLPRALADLQAAIYKIPVEAFAEHARLRADAMALRDGRGERITEEDWANIGEMLDGSWKSLHRAVNQRH